MSTLQITSVFTGQTWDGEVETTDLDEIFRLFNRVEDGDSFRLEKLGFLQPSVSSGDLLVLNSQNFVVLGLGFARLTDNQAAAYRFQIEKVKDNDNFRPPMAQRMEGDSLRFFGNEGRTEIAPDGTVSYPEES